MNTRLKRYGFILAMLFSLCSMAQNKLLTVEEAVMKGRTSLAPARLNQLMWVTGADMFTYVLKVGDMEKLVRGNVANTNVDTLLTVDELSKAVYNADAVAPAFKSFPAITWVSPKSFRIVHNHTVFLYDVEGKRCYLINKFLKDAENTDFETTGNAMAFTLQNNLFVYFSDQSVSQTSSNDNKGIVSGQAVHRNEFGIVKGTFWSPKGRYMAFYRMDETMVDQYPIMDLSKKPAGEELIRYPMAGKTSHQVKIGVLESSSKTVIDLKTGLPSDQYLTNVAWSPDERFVYVAVLNREQNYLRLNEYSAETGDFIRTIFEEKSEKYVEPEHPMLWVKKHDDQFIWQSEQDGYNHLYLYNKSGKLIRQLTKGQWVVTDVMGFDESGSHVFIQATKESAIERHIYKVNLNNGKLTKISANVPGTHTALVSSNGKYILDSYSSTLIPRNIDILTTEGKPVRTLLTAKNPLADYKLPELSIFTIRAADGVTDLYCRMLKPIDFSPQKKYPVLVYLYGGPHLQLVSNTFMGGGDLWLVYMAQQGYVVFTVDNRGSRNRGRDFEQATHLRLGTNEMADQLKGVEFLHSLTFVDTTRMGVFGWSFGGFLTTTLMTRSPATFKAAVAGGPVIDWSMYEVMYTERYMSIPQENKKGYEEANLLNYVSNLKGKLLLIHGTSDDVVVWQHSLKYLEECVKKSVLVDYLVYPGHKHNVLGQDRVHLMKKITQYFNEHL